MGSLSNDIKTKYLKRARRDAREDPEVVWSSDNIVDTLDYFTKDDARITEDNFDQLADYVADQLVQEGLIYRAGDKEGYRRLVRDKELISASEKSMWDTVQRGKQLNPNYAVVFRDTEFPVGPDYRYIID